MKKNDFFDLFGVICKAAANTLSAKKAACEHPAEEKSAEPKSGAGKRPLAGGDKFSAIEMIRRHDAISKKIDMTEEKQG